MKLNEIKIGIVGLGYVGLPLAVEFGKILPVMGFDINEKRITQLLNGFDETLEVNKAELSSSINLSFSNKTSDLDECNFYIVTVPTPINLDKEPNLKPLISASEMLGSLLNVGDIVVFESTVYPGTTEEICVPVLEKTSNLKFNKDFYVGYSPERINPGDKTHKLPNITKLISGSTKASTDIINKVYSKIITAGTFVTENIKVAEAAKVIENTQRDLNIALINELSKIFTIMNIDTESVLKAAGTKWNFLNFRPGLVGGHCIGVDPYYLTYKAQELGYHPEVILAGRRINDNMGKYVASNLLTEMINKNIDISNSKVLIMGYTFKENCPDIRNTKVADVYKELIDNNIDVDVYDPWIKDEDINNNPHINFIKTLINSEYDGLVIAVAHDKFKKLKFKDINNLCKPIKVIYDLKYILDHNNSDLRL
jgi:UDP-N-acetyl-D-galactosamine dehydrogenase